MKAAFWGVFARQNQFWGRTVGGRQYWLRHPWGACPPITTKKKLRTLRILVTHCPEFADSWDWVFWDSKYLGQLGGYDSRENLSLLCV
ncbi:hypothetical protein NBRC3188_2916 [Acetobacter pasteurianus NBRC 3188]|uniref:Uncharacterized protein n=1 Tax=Acetobacter pasteurianus NBRC 3188 TaxID=1226663 RepID=A0A401WXY7_ACEPA|nr:hypothetical protein NBRC3188_2916 [Acetobacter pasteurianus NBRC 3188]